LRVMSDLITNKNKAIMDKETRYRNKEVKTLLLVLTTHVVFALTLETTIRKEITLIIDESPGITIDTREIIGHDHATHIGKKRRPKPKSRKTGTFTSQTMALPTRA